MRKMEMKDVEGTAYTLTAYSKALKRKVRLVIWLMPNGKKKLFEGNLGCRVLVIYQFFQLAILANGMVVIAAK